MCVLVGAPCLSLSLVQAAPVVLLGIAAEPEPLCPCGTGSEVGAAPHSCPQHPRPQCGVRVLRDPGVSTPPWQQQAVPARLPSHLENLIHANYAERSPSDNEDEMEA